MEGRFICAWVSCSCHYLDHDHVIFDRLVSDLAIYLSVGDKGLPPIGQKILVHSSQQDCEYGLQFPRFIVLRQTVTCSSLILVMPVNKNAM